MWDPSYYRRTPAAGLLSLVLLGAASALSAQSQETLSGTWKLNPEKTAAERREVADPQTREGYARGGQPRVGTGVTDPRGGGRGAGRGGDLGPLSPYARSLPELVIVQSDSTVLLSDPSGQPHTYWIDGRKETLQLPGVEPTEMSARLRSGKLTIERKVGKAGTVREVYSLRGGGDELLVEVRLSGGDLAEPMNLKRVYDKGQPKS